MQNDTFLRDFLKKYQITKDQIIHKKWLRQTAAENEGIRANNITAEEKDK